MSGSQSHSPTPQEESEAKLLAYIDGELDEAGRAEIERHLEANPNHRRLLQELKTGRDLLRWVPRESAPPELMENFQSQLERAVLLEEEDEDAAEEAGSLRINPWHQFRAVAAVLLLAVMLGVVVWAALPRLQNRNVAGNQAAPATDGSATDGAAPMPEPMAAQPGDSPAESAPTRADRAERSAKGAPGDAEAKIAGPGASDPPIRGKIGPPDGGAAGNAVADSGPAPMPLASARETIAELERANSEQMSNTVRNLAQAEAVQVAIERNTVARPRARYAAKGGAEGDAYADPLYVVVNTSDPDRAREQIHAYLHSNGIRNVEILDQAVAALQAPDRMGANFNAAPAPRDAAKPLAHAEERLLNDQQKSKRHVARAPEGQSRSEGSRDQTGAVAQGQAGGGAVERQEAPLRRDGHARSSPATAPAVAKAATPQQYQNQSGLQERQGAPMAELPEVRLRHQQQQQLTGLEQQQRTVFNDELQRIDRVLVARGMNRRQAVAMQRSFNNPTQAQWAGVYEQPAESRRAARGRGAGLAYDPAAGAVAPPGAPGAAGPAAPAAPGLTLPADANAGLRPTDRGARTVPDLGRPLPGQAPPAPTATARQPNPQRTGTAERDDRLTPRTRDARGDRLRSPTTRPAPAAPPNIAARPAPATPTSTTPPALRPGAQPNAARTPAAADKGAVAADKGAVAGTPAGAVPGRPAVPTPGGAVASSPPPAEPSSPPDRKAAAGQVVTGRPTTRPSAVAAPVAQPVAQAEDTPVADQDQPLDVVIVLQRAPLAGAPSAEQHLNAKADQAQAPATSPAAATRPAR